MKAFHFRLDPALRWRGAQLRLEQEHVSRAAGLVAMIRAELIAAHTDLRAGSADLVRAGGAALALWAAYADRCRRRIHKLEEQLREANQALALQMQKMTGAHQKLRVLENLKQANHSTWVRELDREAEVFAGEAFLAKLSRNPRPENH